MEFIVILLCLVTIVLLGFTTVHFWDNGYYVAGNICWTAAAVLAIALLSFT